MNSKHRTAATAAWQAYNAMETTKRRHLDYLSALESREKRFNLAASDAENSMLKRLLNDHDAQVSAFKAASNALRETNPAAFDALWVYIGEMNEALAPFVPNHVH